MSLLLYTTFLLCGAIGQTQGIQDAVDDGLKDTTTRPVVKLFSAEAGVTEYADGNYHLLKEDEDKFFIFEPAGLEGSVILIHSIPKNKIGHYEVTVK